MATKDDKYSDLTLLGTKAAIPSSPEEAKLEFIKNQFPENNNLVELKTTEFTSLCPVTDQPDYGEIIISYNPAELLIESKSLKLYLASFRNSGMFQEFIVNKILNDLKTALKPNSITVIGNFNARGGISISSTVTWSK